MFCIYLILFICLKLKSQFEKLKILFNALKIFSFNYYYYCLLNKTVIKFIKGISLLLINFQLDTFEINLN